MPLFHPADDIQELGGSFSQTFSPVLVVSEVEVKVDKAEAAKEEGVCDLEVCRTVQQNDTENHWLVFRRQRIVCGPLCTHAHRKMQA